MKEKGTGKFPELRTEGVKNIKEARNKARSIKHFLRDILASFSVISLLMQLLIR